MDLDGTHSWTPEEFEEKEAAMIAAPRRYASVAKGAVGDDLTITDNDYFNFVSEFTYHLDALNFLLVHLNFPNKLKPFLDSICGAAGASGNSEFSATNWEIGQRSRSGRNACSDGAMEKWVSRQKSKLDEWMRWKGFEIVKIVLGEYNYQTKRRAPTRYQVNFNQYVVETVWIAKTKFYWRGDKNSRRRQGRALREAAREVITRIPEAPPLRPVRDNSLSEQKKFDRRHTLIMSSLEKQRDALAKIKREHTDYFIFVVKEADKIALNPPGLAGKILTPEHHEPAKSISIWNKVQSGEILEMISAADRVSEEQIQNIFAPEDQQDIFSGDTKSLKTNDATNKTFLSGSEESEPENPSGFRYWSDGGWVDHSNSIPIKSDTPEVRDG